MPGAHFLFEWILFLAAIFELGRASRDEDSRSVEIAARSRFVAAESAVLSRESGVSKTQAGQVQKHKQGDARTHTAESKTMAVQVQKHKEAEAHHVSRSNDSSSLVAPVAPVAPLAPLAPGNDFNDQQKTGKLQAVEEDFDELVRRLERQTKEDRDKKHLDPKNALGGLGDLVLQMLVVVVFFYLVASKYPNLEQPNDASKAVMEESPVFRCNFGPVCMQSWCCLPGMVGLVADKVGVLSYWPASIMSVCFPCCVLWYLRNMTELNVKLGGTEDTLVQGCFLSCCCGCCTIARDADALGEATGSKIGWCSPSSGGAPVDERAKSDPSPVEAT